MKYGNISSVSKSDVPENIDIHRSINLPFALWQLPLEHSSEGHQKDENQSLYLVQKHLTRKEWKEEERQWRASSRTN
jgi:hypothetical protein